MVATDHLVFKLGIGIGKRMLSQRPLKILFFGSDEFSIHSLRALDTIRKTCSSIETIQLVTRSPKWCGRQKSVMKYPPIVKASEKLGLSTPLLAETKQDWTALKETVIKNEFNMIVAVSFGKLIPRRLIESVKYSLNVHPSLLPRYKGASPIQYALLNNDEFTGVTVQTLDPLKFDNGSIIAQTSPYRIEDLLAKGTKSSFDDTIPLKTATMMDQLGIIGASLLSRVITERFYERSMKSVASYEPSYAPKITAEMKRIDWGNEYAEDILNKLQVIGPLYTFKEAEARRQGSILKRVILHKLCVVSTEENSDLNIKTPGTFEYHKEDQSIYIRCRGAQCIKVKELQFEGHKNESPKQFMTSLCKRCGSVLGNQWAFAT